MSCSFILMVKDVAMVTSFGPNLYILLTPPLFFSLKFQNRLPDCNCNFRRLHGKDSCTLYRNLVNFGPVTPESVTLECVH